MKPTICPVCSKTLSRSDALKSHIQRKHPNQFPKYGEKRTDIKCGYCGKYFARKYTLKIHIKRSHPTHFHDVIKEFKCQHCHKLFDHKVHLKAHLKTHNQENNITNVSSVKTKSSVKMCAICRHFQTASTEDMLKHLTNNHEIAIQAEQHEFSSVAEFFEWKIQIEEEHCTQYRKNTTKSSKHHVLTKFACTRSGNYKSRSCGKRHLKIQGSKKINSFCPSSIDLFVKTDGSCSVKYTKPHVGHKPELTHMILTKEEKEEIAKQIAQKIPFSIILDGIRDSVIDSNLKRIHLSNRKDLFNVEYSYQLAHPPTWHKNDAVSVEAWVNSVQEKGNGVLFYKPQGALSDEYTDFKEEDFILVIMTAAQAEILQKYDADIICVDGTHGTNSYDFELHTIMVIDELREGFPAAFLISNLSNAEVFSLFFREIQKQIGSIKCRIFMSDMAEAYFNAWLVVMGKPERRLWCTWHVDKAWRKNLNSKIQSKELRAIVYKQLRVLLHERDEDAVKKMIVKFYENHCLNPDMADFIKYFEQYYMKNLAAWAYCYRKFAKINTNMRLERLHRTLKYEYLNGKKVKRLDKSIIVIMRLVRDKLFQKLIAGHKGKLCSTISTIRARHKKSTEIDDQLVTKTDEAFVLPSKNSTELYYVYRDTERCHCSLRCSNCNICIHEFYCTCLDSSIKFNMCKHIHVVGRLLKDPQNVLPNEVKDCGDLIIEEDTGPDLGTILQEISNKQVQSQLSLEKRQDQLSEYIIGIIKTTKSVEELDCLAKISASMAPTLAAVREKSDNVESKSFVKKDNCKRRNITPQRKFRSTKNKQNLKKRENILEKPSPDESNAIAINLIL